MALRRASRIITHWLYHPFFAIHSYQSVAIGSHNMNLATQAVSVYFALFLVQKRNLHNSKELSKTAWNRMIFSTEILVSILLIVEAR